MIDFTLLEPLHPAPGLSLRPCAMPGYKSFRFWHARAGVVENILGRVLDAFQVRCATLLGGAAARPLAEAPNLAGLMAREPAAPQAGDALAFFCGRPGDPADAWLAAAGGAFGQGGEAAQFEVVAKVAQVCA